VVRINEFGEIIREDAPPSRSPSPPPSAPPPPPPPSTGNDKGGVVGGMTILGAVLFGALGALGGYGAGERWFATEAVESATWGKGFGTFFHCLFIASWSADPVHHAMQDVSIPLRVLLIGIAGIGLLIACFNQKPPSNEESGGCSLLFAVLVMVLLGAAGASLLVRLLTYALTYPVTWFLDSIDGPWTGLLVVGLCWAVIGGVLGLIVGGIMAATDA
jgi:hypothetical protein